MRKFFTASAAVACLCGIGLSDASAAGYGKLTGQVVLDGKSPVLKATVMKGDATVKDAACCSAKEVPNEAIVVNPANNGIAHVFVYLKTIEATAIHPDLKTPKESEVVFDQEGCKFTPHAMVVRKGQSVVVKSNDPIQHNTHTYTLSNASQNTLIGANERTGVKFPPFVTKERLPSEIKCDIHPWMKAWWLIVDHPYAVVTDADGKFSIDKLPEGEHKLIIWQESVGYVEKDLVIKVKADGTTDLKQVKLLADKIKL